MFAICHSQLSLVYIFSRIFVFFAHLFDHHVRLCMPSLKTKEFSLMYVPRYALS